MCFACNKSVTNHMLPQIRTSSLIAWSWILASHPAGLALPSTKMLFGVPLYIICPRCIVHQAASADGMHRPAMQGSLTSLALSRCWNVTKLALMPHVSCRLRKLDLIHCKALQVHRFARRLWVARAAQACMESESASSHLNRHKKSTGVT